VAELPSGPVECDRKELVALSLDLAAALPLDPGWGLEIGMLCDLFRQVDPRQVCQVDAGLRYDHKHQPLGDRRQGLVRMAGEIAVTLLGHLRQEGIRPSPAFLEAVVASYRREAGEALRRSALLARINGLGYAAQEEEQAVDSFCDVLQNACRAYPPGHHRQSKGDPAPEVGPISKGMEMRLSLPPWNRPTALNERALARLKIY